MMTSRPPFFEPFRFVRIVIELVIARLEYRIVIWQFGRHLQEDNPMFDKFAVLEAKYFDRGKLFAEEETLCANPSQIIFCATVSAVDVAWTL